MSTVTEITQITDMLTNDAFDVSKCECPAESLREAGGTAVPSACWPGPAVGP